MESFNIVDAAIAAVVLWCAAAGLFRGLVRQAIGVGGLVAGHLAGIRWYAWAQNALRLHFPYAEAAGYLVLLVSVYLLVRLAGIWIEGRVRKSKLSGADRFAGMLAGLVKGILFAVIFVFLLVVFLPREAKVLRESRLSPTVIAAGRLAARVFPERIGAMFREKVEGAVPAREAPRRGPGK